MEGRGEALMSEAEGILRKGGGLFGGLFGTASAAYEDAADKFQKAAMAFKAVKKWADAGRAFQRAAECYVKAKSEGEAASAFTESARAYVKAGDSKTAVDLLEKEALPRVADASRLSQAAKLHQEIAEMLEAEGALDAAIDNYQKAADFFSAENQNSTAHKCLVRVAHLSAQMEPPNLEKAAEVFEHVGRESLASPLLKFQTRTHFFHAFLCTLARNDIVAATANLERYKEMDYTFPGSRECKLCEDVGKAVSDMNAEEFTNAVYNYDQISKLNPWQTSILLRIKNSISGVGVGGGGAGGAGSAIDDELGITG